MAQHFFTIWSWLLALSKYGHERSKNDEQKWNGESWCNLWYKILCISQVKTQLCLFFFCVCVHSGVFSFVSSLLFFLLLFGSLHIYTNGTCQFSAFYDAQILGIHLYVVSVSGIYYDTFIHHLNAITFSNSIDSRENICAHHSDSYTTNNIYLFYTVLLLFRDQSI